MENISEKTPRARGRPRKATAAEWALTTLTDGKSHRHKANYIYRLRAIRLVADDPRFEWLCSDGDTIMRGAGHMRSTILNELGRIDNEQAMEAMALYLCAQQPTTRQAVALIRQFRLGTRPPSSPEQLADVLRSALNTYLGEHQRLPWDEVRQAFYEVLRDVDMTERKGEPPTAP